MSPKQAPRRLTVRFAPGLFRYPHRQRMGPAIWTFGWCVDHQTGKDGAVLHGRFIAMPELAVGCQWHVSANEPCGLGTDERTVRRDLQRLARPQVVGGDIFPAYLELTRGQHGIAIKILKQKKF